MRVYALRVYACLAAALIGSALALLEFSLTRLYGLLYPATWVFLLVGPATCGLATGAFLAHRFGWRAEKRAGVGAFGAALAGLLVTAIAGLAGRLGGAVYLEWLFAFLVFAAAGVGLAIAYALVPRNAALVAVVLFFAFGVTAALAPALFDLIWPLSAILGVAALLGAGGLIYGVAWIHARTARDSEEEWDDEEGLGKSVRWVVVAATGLMIVASVGALPVHLMTGWPALDPALVSSSKWLFSSVQATRSDLRERVVATTWSHEGRTDVTETAPSAPVKWLYQEGEFSGLMHQSRAGERLPDRVAVDIGNVPFLLPEPHEKVLIIGAGGGQEILMALAAGTKEIVVAEPSAGILSALRAHADFNGGLLERNGVRVVQQDGRDFLRWSGEQFDVIYLSLGTPGNAQPGGVRIGSQQHTIQAFNDYMDGLRQDGRFVLRLRDDHELIRAFNTAFQLWMQRGAQPLEALRRLVAINNQPIAEQSGQAIVLPVLTVRKTPYSETEAQALIQVLQSTPYVPIYAPGLEQMSPLTGFAVEEVGPAGFEDGAPYDIRPVSDSRPFFFEPAKGLPWLVLLIPIGILLVTGGIAWLSRRPAWEAADGDDIASGFLEDTVPWRFLAFAAVASAGWGFVQLPLLHHMPLVIGNAALSPPLVYAALFLGASLGNVVAARFGPANLRPVIGWAGLVGGLLAIAYLELLPMVTTALRGQTSVVRLGVAFIVLFPLGVCLGIPFPSAVRLLAANGRGGWTAMLVAVAVLAFGIAQIYAYAFGLAWSFTIPVLLGMVCLFAAFMMAGLRALPLSAVPAPAEAPAPDLSQFQRPAVELPTAGPAVLSAGRSPTNK
ncbi:MAG TPA: hypothetical protein VGW38_04135 [Chloroflexota bacterium]|nr:hypothetical protein [Chloroflexota bacterium]